MFIAGINRYDVNSHHRSFILNRTHPKEMPELLIYQSMKG